MSDVCCNSYLDLDTTLANVKTILDELDSDITAAQTVVTNSGTEVGSLETIVGNLKIADAIDCQSQCSEGCPDIDGDGACNSFDPCPMNSPDDVNGNFICDFEELRRP
eukprot:UN19631